MLYTKMSFEVGTGVLTVATPLLVTNNNNAEPGTYLPVQDEVLSLLTQPSSTVPGKHGAFTFSSKGLLTGVDSSLIVVPSDIPAEYVPPVYGVEGTYYQPVFELNENGNVISIVDTKELTADWMTGTLTNSGSAATETVVASSLDAAYDNQIPDELNAASGVYITSYAGRYLITATVITTSGGVGDHIRSVAIKRTSASPASSGKTICWSNSATSTGAGTFANEFSLATTTPLAVNDTVWVDVTNQTGASDVDYNAHISIMWLNAI